jgi:hypothetical protein
VGTAQAAEETSSDNAAAERTDLIIVELLLNCLICCVEEQRRQLDEVPNTKSPMMRGIPWAMMPSGLFFIRLIVRTVRGKKWVGDSLRDLQGGQQTSVRRGPYGARFLRAKPRLFSFIQSRSSAVWSIGDQKRSQLPLSRRNETSSCRPAFFLLF